MWRNSTSSLSVITSTVLLSLAVDTSATTITSDVIRNDKLNINECVIKNQKNSFFWGNKKTITEKTMIDESLQRNIKKLMSISLLKDNWNGNGAKVFDKALLEKIKKIVLELDRQPEIFPTAANSIQLEYDGPSDSYLEIEILEAIYAEVFKIDKNGKEEYCKISADSGAINRMVEAFYG